MSTSGTSVLCALTFSLLVVAGRDAQAQTEPASVDGSAAVDTGLSEIEEIIVRGRSFGDLRFEIERFEEAVFARFNEINSTDDFDVHCRTEKYFGLRGRSCQSNFFREMQAQDAAASVRAWRNGTSENLALRYLLGRESNRLQQLMNAEMRQLAAEDELLDEALAELTQAQLALTLARGNETLSRQVTAASGRLPHGAELMFEIIMGVHPFRHRLTQQTFTVTDVLGEVRKLEVACAEGRQRFDYESGVDWTVPDGWSGCTLEVNAKRQTTFRLYEFSPGAAGALAAP